MWCQITTGVPHKVAARKQSSGAVASTTSTSDAAGAPGSPEGVPGRSPREARRLAPSPLCSRVTRDPRAPPGGRRALDAWPQARTLRPAHVAREVASSTCASGRGPRGGSAAGLERPHRGPVGIDARLTRAPGGACSVSQWTSRQPGEGQGALGTSRCTWVHPDVPSAIRRS
jgi:hypothetical protein